jgi:hypothetical protein
MPVPAMSSLGNTRDGEDGDSTPYVDDAHWANTKSVRLLERRLAPFQMEKTLAANTFHDPALRLIGGLAATIKAIGACCIPPHAPSRYGLRRCKS